MLSDSGEKDTAEHQGNTEMREPRTSKKMIMNLHIMKWKIACQCQRIIDNLR